MKTSTEALKEF